MSRLAQIADADRLTTPASSPPGSPSLAKDHLRHAVRGFAGAGPSRDSDAAAETGELATLYVDPDCWRRGAGTSLQGHALEALAGAGFRTAILWVLAANVRALRFYERTGWSAEGKTKYEHHGSAVLHEVRYWRTLPLASSGDLPRTSFPAL